MFYAYAIKNQRTISKLQSIRNNNNEIVTNKLEIVNILNEKFQSVFVKEDLDKLPNFGLKTKNELNSNTVLKANKRSNPLNPAGPKERSNSANVRTPQLSICIILLFI